MIISKKKFEEKVREALAQQEREKWIHERIAGVERDSCRRDDELSKHLYELEKKIALLLDEKKQAKGESNGSKQ